MKINGMSLLGLIVLGLGSFGVFNAVQSFGKPEVEKRDISTTGIITRIHGTEITHRLTNVALNSQFNIDYTFTAEDGREYSDSSIVDKSLFHSLREGDKIGVRYHSHNPAICASEYGHYTPVSDMPKSTPLFRLFFSLGFFCLGGLILFYAFLDGQPGEDSGRGYAARSEGEYSGAYNSQMC